MTTAEAEQLLGLFPPSATLDADGVLVVGGCRLDDVAAEVGTPVMVVDEAALRQRARAFRDGLAARWPDNTWDDLLARDVAPWR